MEAFITKAKSLGFQVNTGGPCFVVVDTKSYWYEAYFIGKDEEQASKDIDVVVANRHQRDIVKAVRDARKLSA
jgi:hypothetical protein